MQESVAYISSALPDGTKTSKTHFLLLDFRFSVPDLVPIYSKIVAIKKGLHFGNHYIGNYISISTFTRTYIFTSKLDCVTCFDTDC